MFDFRSGLPPTVVSSVPEPGSAGLLALGLTWLALRRGRRRLPRAT